jgi:DNA-directed RNA polymerase sigma subunit (sigma70/sigma32)
MRLSDLDISKPQLIELTEFYVFNARNKALFLRKIEGYTYEEVAEEFNLSTVRTKEIVKDCLERISKHI